MLWAKKESQNSPAKLKALLCWDISNFKRDLPWFLKLKKKKLLRGEVCIFYQNIAASILGSTSSELAVHLRGFGHVLEKELRSLWQNVTRDRLCKNLLEKVGTLTRMRVFTVFLENARSCDWLRVTVGCNDHRTRVFCQRYYCMKAWKMLPRTWTQFQMIRHKKRTR